jgi:hypothetical protein
MVMKRRGRTFRWRRGAVQGRCLCRLMDLPFTRTDRDALKYISASSYSGHSTTAVASAAWRARRTVTEPDIRAFEHKAA